MSVSKAVRLRVSVGGELTVLQKKQRMFPLSVMRLSNDDAALRALVSDPTNVQVRFRCSAIHMCSHLTPRAVLRYSSLLRKLIFGNSNVREDAHVISISWGSGIFRPSQTHLR